MNLVQYGLEWKISIVSLGTSYNLWNIGLILVAQARTFNLISPSFIEKPMDVVDEQLEGLNKKITMMDLTI